MVSWRGTKCHEGVHGVIKGHEKRSLNVHFYILIVEFIYTNKVSFNRSCFAIFFFREILRSDHKLNHNRHKNIDCCNYETVSRKLR